MINGRGIAVDLAGLSFEQCKKNAPRLVRHRLSQLVKILIHTRFYPA